jgi:mannose-1-phosphate guanylyltransferase
MAKVVILAGGFGKRLRPLTIDKPKPLVEVAGRPIIEWQILLFKSLGYRDFVVLAGYKWEKLVERLGSGRRLGVRIAYVVEDEPLGTGGAIKNAEHLLAGEDYFYVVNGDVITNLDARRLPETLSSRSGLVGAIALVPLPSPYGIVEVDDSGLVRRFIEKPRLDYWINAGVYAFTPEVFRYLPEQGDIERRGFPELAREGRLAGVKYSGVYWRSIDTVKDVEEASKQLAEAPWARQLEALAQPGGGEAQEA